MKKRKRTIVEKGVAIALSAALVFTSVSVTSPGINADEKATEVRVETDGYTVHKISNPGCGQGEFDGLVDGGDRYNSYAWCMASRGDKLYIGTIRGLSESVIGSVVLGLQAKGLSKEEAYALIDTITNSDFGHDTVEKGGDIISYDIKTGEMKVLTTGEKGTSFRMAINYNNDIYIGSYAGVTNNIYRIDKEDNIEKVYETASGTSMRAACEYEGELFFGGVDSSEELTEEYEGAAKLAILKMDKDNPSKWDRVADYSDFDPVYATNPAVKSQITSPIWDIVSYGGYIYATLPYSGGFIAYKGRPAVGGESSNEYGWHWEEVIGLNNGINNVALAEEREGYTGDAAGKLSITATPFVFKDKLYLMDFDNTLGSMTTTLTNLLNPFGVEKGELLRAMYTTLSHPQSLWVLDDATGKFEKVENFSKLMEGTCNEYLWRTAEYDGELYITTMDSSVIYRYLTQYTDLGLDMENLEDKATSIINIANLMELFELDQSENENISKIAKIVISLADIIKKSKEELSEEEVEEINAYFEKLSEQFEENAEKYLDEMNDKEVLSDIKQDFAEGKGEENDNIKLIRALDVDGDELSDDDELSLEDVIKNIIELIQNNSEYIEEIVQKTIETVEEIDWQTVYMYSYIASRVNNEVQGFDMFKTSDGVNFTVVTNNGFGDRYNYGGRTLEPTEDGLFIGTSNPFYGAQLFKLTNKKESQEETTAEETTAEETTVAPKADNKVGLSVKKSNVVLAPNKKTEVAYSVNAGSGAKVTATSSDTKLVKVSVEDGKIAIKATKASKKSRGTVVKVTVKAGDEQKVINVAVKNRAKKIAAKKKSISVNKGDTVKVTFKVVSAQNKKKAVTNLFGKKATKAASIKKIAVVKSVKIKKGKIIVKIMAKKKGTATLNLKLTDKIKAKTKITVK